MPCPSEEDSGKMPRQGSGDRTPNAVAEDVTMDGLRHHRNEKAGSHRLNVGASLRSRVRTQNVVPEKGTMIGFGNAEARRLPTGQFCEPRGSLPSRQGGNGPRQGSVPKVQCVREDDRQSCCHIGRISSATLSVRDFERQ